jgi:hypothetical protein
MKEEHSKKSDAPWRADFEKWFRKKKAKTARLQSSFARTWHIGRLGVFFGPRDDNRLKTRIVL